MKVDKVFINGNNLMKRFEFNETVADVFPDMLNRSIPCYGPILVQIGNFATKYTVENSNVYDLGCSHGAVSLELLTKSKKNCQIISVDNSEAMVNRCRSLLSRNSLFSNFEVILGDINSVKIENASLVVLNYTLQFVAPQFRLDLIRRIFDGLNDGGVLILSEKICFENEQKTAFHDELYYDFKRANGYSEMEISRKRESLETVLIRDTSATHLKRLTSTGFNVVEKWFSYLNFASYIAIK